MVPGSHPFRRRRASGAAAPASIAFPVNSFGAFAVDMQEAEPAPEDGHIAQVLDRPGDGSWAANHGGRVEGSRTSSELAFLGFGTCDPRSSPGVRNHTRSGSPRDLFTLPDKRRGLPPVPSSSPGLLLKARHKRVTSSPTAERRRASDDPWLASPTTTTTSSGSKQTKKSNISRQPSKATPPPATPPSTNSCNNNGPAGPPPSSSATAPPGTPKSPSPTSAHSATNAVTATTEPPVTAPPTQYPSWGPQSSWDTTPARHRRAQGGGC